MCFPDIPVCLRTFLREHNSPAPCATSCNNANLLGKKGVFVTADHLAPSHGGQLLDV